MGLFLPRNRSATCVARRPSTAPSASITRHGRSFEFTFGKYVFIFPKKRNDFIRRARKVNRYLCLKHVRTAAARLKKTRRLSGDRQRRLVRNDLRPVYFYFSGAAGGGLDCSSSPARASLRDGSRISTWAS